VSETQTQNFGFADHCARLQIIYLLTYRPRPTDCFITARRMCNIIMHNLVYAMVWCLSVCHKPVF